MMIGTLGIAIATLGSFWISTLVVPMHHLKALCAVVLVMLGTWMVMQ